MTDPSQLIADLRARVEASTQEIEQLAGALAASRALSDDLETLVDVLLGIGEVAVLVVDDDRRIRGLSRAAAERIEGAAVGKPLSSALSDDVFEALSARLEDGAAGAHGAGGGADIYPLPGGGAVVVLEER
ncbi:MAG TPA: hypothetical protein VH479_13250 [Acidimicrobiales bacterium]|jgi:hypothetical protein